MKTRMILLFFLFLLVGCSTKKVDIELKDETVYSISKGLKTACMFIKKINGIEVNENTNFNDFGIECMEIDLSKPQFNSIANIYVNGDVITKVFNVQDIEKPNIKIKESELEIKKDSFININELYEVQDNYDEHPEVKVEGFYNVNVPGKYLIKIIAFDSSKNQNQQDLIINVVEFTKEELALKKVEEEKRLAEEKRKDEEAKKAKAVENIITPSYSSEHKTEPAITTSHPRESVKKGVYKKFLFTEGYNMETVYQACYNYLNSFGSGECVPLKNNNTYIGYEYNP